MDRVDTDVTVVGRYALYGAIARGGMATVHFGRLVGPVGFARTVAIKRLHPQYATEPEFVSMFVDEALLAARIRSPHVVPTVDVVATGGELFLVMDYVSGESLSRLLQFSREAGERAPLPIAVAVMAGVLHGLHAAHEARDAKGAPLGIVHRDVSPQNILVGTDGLARVLDFGVAKAAGRLQTTRDGQLKGKLAYMSPEQLRNESVTRQADIYAASVVLWEALTGGRLFAGDSEGGIVTSVLLGKVTPPSRVVSGSSAKADAETMRALERLDAVVLRGLDRSPAKRFESARDMALALEKCLPAATAVEVSHWVERLAGRVLAERAARVAEIESNVAEPGAPSARVDAAPLRPTSGAAAESPTQASSISVSTSSIDAMSRRPRRRSRIVLATGLAIAVLAAVLLLRAPRAPSPAAPSAASSPPAPSASFGGDVAGSTTPAASSVPAPSAEPVAAPPASSVPAAASTPATAPRRSPRPARPSDCNPPFTWDAQGRKIYKSQCL